MKNNNDNFLIFLSTSIAFHLVLIYFFLFGLPSFIEKLPEEQVITFEILPVSTKPNVPTQKKQLEKPIENEDAKKVEKSAPKEKKPVIEEKKQIPAEEKPLETPMPVEEHSNPKEEKPVEKIIEPNKLPEKKKLPVEKKKIPEKKEKPVEKKKEPEKKTKKVNDDLESLLKNLEESSEGNNAKSSKQARSAKANIAESKGKFNEDLPLSVSESSLIRRQIESHWNNVPPGARNNDQVKVILYIAFDKSGNVEQVKLEKALCSNIPSSICQALTDSAIRAVWQASPIKDLDPSRYNVWKEIIFLFDPSKL